MLNRGPSGRAKFHQAEIRPAVVGNEISISLSTWTKLKFPYLGRYYGVAVSRAREAGVQFTLRLATTEFLRPEGMCPVPI